MKKVKINFDIDPQYGRCIDELVNTLVSAGYECYMVGGSVRDMVLGIDAYDFDFATNAKPESVSKLFKHVIPTGIKHGTVTVLFGKKSFEITTYRCDGKYSDGRRPENITYSETLEEDVMRRDFTINGLAYDWKNHEIIDYVGGMEDLEKRIIYTIGNPIERLTEDGLRSYRACRIASKLKFEIEESTMKAMKNTLHVSEKVSVERVREEIMKILATEKPSVGIEYMRICGLLYLSIPELLACYGIDQNKYHKYDIYYHSLYSCDAAPVDKPLIRLTALLHDIGKVPAKRKGPDGDGTFYNHEIVGAHMARRIMKRLKFSNDETDKVVNLVTNHMFHYTSDWHDGAVRRFLNKVGHENLDELFVLRMADRSGRDVHTGIPAPMVELKKRINKVIEDDNAFKITDLNITGHDLMKNLDIVPGPVIGYILNELLEIVLDHPEFNKNELLLNKAKEILPEALEKSRDHRNK